LEQPTTQGEPFGLKYAGSPTNPSAEASLIHLPATDWRALVRRSAPALAAMPTEHGSAEVNAASNPAG
jgi:hypothetical protein